MCVSVLPFLPVVNNVPFLKLGYVSLVLIPGQKAIFCAPACEPCMCVCLWFCVHCFITWEGGNELQLMIPALFGKSHVGTVPC